MRRRLLAALAAIVFAVVLPTGAGAADAGRPFATTLTGAAEVPPADPDASGSAAILLNQGLGTVCFDLSWENVDGTVFAAHIHVAPAGANGPIRPLVRRFVRWNGLRQRMRREHRPRSHQGHPARSVGLLRERAQYAELPWRGDQGSA